MRLGIQRAFGRLDHAGAAALARFVEEILRRRKDLLRTQFRRGRTAVGEQAGNGRLTIEIRLPLSILFSNGSRARLFFAVDALGCLRSLRARLALDGVSWVQGGLVEIAVSHWLAACNRIGAVICSLPRASLLMGAGFGLLSRGFAGTRPTRTLSRLATSRAL